MSGSGFGRSITNAVVAGLLGGAMGVLKTEVENAKNEIEAKLKGLGTGVILLGVAASIGFFALGVLVAAGIIALTLVWPAWLAALVVAGGLLLFVLIFALAGAGKIKKNKDLVPDQAIKNIKHVFNK